MIFKGIHLVSIMGNNGTFNKPLPQILFDRGLMLHVCYLILCISGLFVHPFFLSVLLFDVVNREETLLNVINSVTKNFRSIFFTAFLAIILVYLFSIVGFVFFQDDFIVEAEGLAEVEPYVEAPQSHMLPTCQQPVESSQKERSCDSLAMCIVTTLNQGKYLFRSSTVFTVKTKKVKRIWSACW